jgi:solute carrier family 8 (sodium/calcium exchanger)
MPPRGPPALLWLAALAAMLVMCAAPAACEDVKEFDMPVGRVIEVLPAGTTRCDSYIVAPGGNTYARATRAIFYFVALCYIFLGTALISDQFMAAIEKITSKEKSVVTVRADGSRETLTFAVWNETVANLTLMALGSSAPEILLSVIETLQNISKEPGELGPSTIIGSAAFNLLCITAVCTVAVPEGEIRRVKEVGVYAITSITSIFAYVWLLIVLKIWSENFITMAEAVLTLLFFPALVAGAWAQDNNWFKKTKGKPKQQGGKMGSSHIVQGGSHSSRTPGGGGKDSDKEKEPGHGGVPTVDAGTAKLDGRERERVGAKIKEVRLLNENGKIGRHAEHEADDAAVGAVSKAIVHAKMPKRWSRAHYRSSVMRGFSGKPRVLPSKTMLEHRDLLNVLGPDPAAAGDVSAVFSFANATYSVLEDAGFVEVEVICERTTPRSIPGLTPVRAVTVDYSTADGSATAGSDYIPCRGRITFEPGETKKSISVSIVEWGFGFWGGVCFCVFWGFFFFFFHFQLSSHSHAYLINPPPPPHAVHRSSFTLRLTTTSTRTTRSSLCSWGTRLWAPPSAGTRSLR